MKTGFIAVVVLSLTAYSLADDVGTEGVQCVVKCIDSDSAETSVARSASAFRLMVQRATPSDDSKCTPEKVQVYHCVEECHVEKYGILAREALRIWERNCGAYVDEAIKKKYSTEFEPFGDLWFSERGKCPTEADGPEGVCMVVSDCKFGSALDSAKNGFSNDVVSVHVIWQKIYYASALETSYGESFPSRCNFLFEPSSQPEPYPHGSYAYGHYQPEPYQRNPYQRNVYQRNSYQRNSYQRNPYQRKSYQRNPY